MILNGKVSLGGLAEPYIIIESECSSIDKLSYVVNLFAREKGYRITSFAVNNFFAFAVMEKKITTRMATNAESSSSNIRTNYKREYREYVGNC